MILKTRNNREIQLKIIDLRSLADAELEDLCKKLFDFSIQNTLTITHGYLLKRLKNYSILGLSLSEGMIVGFGFADCRKLSLGLLANMPLIHFGLMIIDKEWRKERVSSIISKNIVRYVIKRSGPKIYLTGFAVSAKCSSPVSFYRLQQASLRIGFPKFNSEGNLHFVSKTRFGQALSQSISNALDLGAITDFVIKESNTDSGFQLTRENYVTNSSYEAKVLTFFEKNVIPNHEVLFISYGHPVMVL